jgi:hypothetical protein
MLKRTHLNLVHRAHIAHAVLNAEAFTAGTHYSRHIESQAAQTLDIFPYVSGIDESNTCKIQVQTLNPACSVGDFSSEVESDLVWHDVGTEITLVNGTNPISHLTGVGYRCRLKLTVVGSVTLTVGAVSKS